MHAQKPDMKAGPAEGNEVASGIFEVSAPFWGYPLSLYFVESGGRWLVVDTGINTTPVERIVPFMEEHGGIGTLDLALLTHGHVDHLGGNAQLRRLASQLQFALHEMDLGWAESLDRHIAQLYRFGEPEAWTLEPDMEALLREGCGDPVAIDRILSDRDLVTFGAGRELEIIHVGGHSPGHVLIRDRLTGTVFSGDALQASGALNSESGWRDFPMYRTVRDYYAGLSQIRALNPTTLCTAHNGVFSGGAVADAIDESTAWSDAFHADIRAIVLELRSVTLREAVAAVSQRRPEYAVSLQINVTTAEHLNELVRSGEARTSRDEQGKRWTWGG